MKVTLMLADAAQAMGGKLYILGGGWSITGPASSPSAIAVKIEVPWSDANRKHQLKVELLDTDFHSVSVPTPTGEGPVEITCNFEAGRPPGLPQGTPIDIPLAFNIGPLPLTPGNRYVWKLSIDNESQEDWQVGFYVRPKPPAPQNS